jgi:hypothetical protein
MMWALAPQACLEKRAHSACMPARRRPVESISRTASAVALRRPGLAMAAMRENSAENTSCGRDALASARVERDTSRAPR